ncbi:MAG: thioredoxin family protein [Myxococcales bacterium]|nr:thioredoxin family protein [Myxococcales bacterium]
MSDFNLSEQLAMALQNNSSVLPLTFAFIAGLVSTLSPCIYPLIPITLSVMGARRYENRLTGFLVASCYVLGMSIVYSCLGIISASLGIISGSLMQNSLVLFIIAGIFIIFSMAMFGVVNIVLPQTFLNKLSSLGGAGFKGAFIMGLVAGVIAAPCTGPVLGFILTLIAQEQHISAGFSLMAFFSLGMGLPFLLLGTFSSLLSHMPKSGLWMEKVKQVLGALILGAAFYYLGLANSYIKNFFIVFRDLGVEVLAMNFLMGLFLVFASPKFVINTISRTVPKIIGACLIALSIAALLNTQDESHLETAQDINWHVIDTTSPANQFDELLMMAKVRKQKVMIDFYADWCVACLKLSNTTFKDPAVREKFKDYFLIKVDATSSSTQLNYVQQRYNIVGLPTLIFLDENGKQLFDESVVGFLD